MIVKLVRGEHYYSSGYHTGGSTVRKILIRLRNLAYAKKVYVHHVKNDGSWVDVSCKYISLAGKNHELWEVDMSNFSGYGNEFVVKYVVNNQIYWDNNNNNNYYLWQDSSPEDSGPMLGNNINVLLYKADIHAGRFYGYIDVRNLAYSKNVDIVYSFDNWNTVKSLTASYMREFQTGYTSLILFPNRYNIERWKFEVNLPVGAEKIEFAVSYTVNGLTYWDNNFGENYTIEVSSPIGILQMPNQPLFVGSYIKLPVIIEPESHISIEDLDFIVPSGPRGGTINRSKDENYDQNNPYVMLLVGYEPGDYQIHVIDKASGDVLLIAEFSSTTNWSNENEGPSLWVSGNFELMGVAGATWGGGSSAMPENYNVVPAKGTHNVAVLLVDTSSQRFNQNDIQTIRNFWQQVVFDGQIVNGQAVSTAHYFREVSYNQFNITGQVFGPVSLPGAWSTYLLDDGNYKGNLWQACATAGDTLINYSNFQHLVCVIQSVDATPTTPKRRVWAHAQSVVVKVKEGDIALGTVDMPADGAHFALSATLAHELGHNLGLGDIYNWSGHPPQIQARHLGEWALMANQGNLPHPVLVHRMMLGWVPENNIKLYNFQAIGGYVDETVTLHPVELNNPPGGRYSGIEVRIAPNWNYYFEYRVAQPNQIGDQNLPNNNRVLGTDVSFADNLNDANRRKPVMLLPTDSDGDGPVLGAGQNFREQDSSDGPNFPTDFETEVTNIDGSKADVRIRYGIYSQPDPSIRPWNPPVWQSPDIEVRNARSKADPKWLNMPLANSHNTLVAKVTNRGYLDAPGVWVDFFIKDFTVNSSGVQPIKIDSVQKDVPAQQTVEFPTIWMPTKAGHYCIEARIRHYQTPGPNSVIEATEFNNIAQSNYVRFISAKSSPPGRKTTSIKVHNLFNEATKVFLRCAKSTNPLFRSYLQHTWLILRPNETRDVQLMFEYAYEEDPVWDPELEGYISLPNDVSIQAVIQQPNAEIEQVPVVVGGVSVQVITGQATKIEGFIFDPPSYIGGRVVTVTGGEPVPGGWIILTFRSGENELEEQTIEVSQNGRFSFNISDTWDTVQAYYVPAEGFSDSISQSLILTPR